MGDTRKALVENNGRVIDDVALQADGIALERARIYGCAARIGIAACQDQGAVTDLYEVPRVAYDPAIHAAGVVAANGERRAAQVDWGVAAHRATLRLKVPKLRLPGLERDMRPATVARAGRVYALELVIVL